MSSEVPARLTWLLQPADTHVFRIFKRKVRSLWVRHRSESLDDTVSAKQWVCIIRDSIQQVLPCNAWRIAFRSTGLLDAQAALSNTLLKRLGLETPPQVMASKPSESYLERIFPKSTKVSSLCLFPRALLAKAKAVPKAVALSSSISISACTRSKVSL